MKKSLLYCGFRYPAEIISHVVWLYFRFALSFRDIEELMASRGIIVTYETIRQWTLKFGQSYANELRRRQPQRGDKWHLDEVVLTIKGKHHYLWRAVDQNGHVLDILMQRRRNRQAAKRFFRKLLKGLRYAPRVLITDRLKSYAAAKTQIMSGVEHRQYKGLNTNSFQSHMQRSIVEASMNKGAAPEGGFLAPTEWDRAITDRLLVVSPMRGICFVHAVDRRQCARPREKGQLQVAKRRNGMRVGRRRRRSDDRGSGSQQLHHSSIQAGKAGRWRALLHGAGIQVHRKHGRQQRHRQGRLHPVAPERHHYRVSGNPSRPQATPALTLSAPPFEGRAGLARAFTPSKKDFIMTDIRKFAVEETSILHLKDANDELMYADGADGKPDTNKPMRIALYGPGSKKFAKVQAANNKLFTRLKKKGKEDQSAEDKAQESAETLTQLTHSFENIGYDTLAGEAL
jgi:putative transposase